jgi:hypothetical protein
LADHGSPSVRRSAIPRNRPFAERAHDRRDTWRALSISAILERAAAKMRELFV